MNNHVNAALGHNVGACYASCTYRNHQHCSAIGTSFQQCSFSSMEERNRERNMGIYFARQQLEREREREIEREREVYLQLDELDSNTYNTYNINIIQYNTYNIVGIQVLLIMLTANCSVPMVLMIYHSDLFYF